MSILKDIIDTGKDIFRTTSDIDDKVTKVNHQSFAKGANDQTFQFPCIVTESIPIDMATTIVRNLDRVYASFVQIYLSANGVVDLNYVKNPRQFVQRYKTNFKLESADDMYSESEKEIVESVRDYYKEFYNGEPRMYTNEEGTAGLMFQESRVTTSMMKNMKNGMNESLSQYNLSLFSEAKDDQKANVLDKMLDTMDKEKEDEDNKNRLDATKFNQSPRMIERDIKKLNDMQPYAMDLKILATKGDTSFSEYMTFTVGVKTTCHLGKAKPLIENIAYVLKNKNGLFNFIRWTTGELSLLKDIVLNLNDINFNVKNRSDKTGRMISRLKDLKKKKIRVSATGLSRVAPFATIVISSYEYNEILNNYGFDLKNVAYAKKVMEELFLMSFIIADETTQTIDMLLDGSTNGFQTYSLETLQREVTMNSNKLGQELTRMLGSSK